jgi:hypothetical protein
VALDWRDVNLATGTLRVGEAKTDAGTYREVDLPAGLIEALASERPTTATGGQAIRCLRPVPEADRR